MAEALVWTHDQLALLGDSRLTGDERVVGLLLSHAGSDGLSYGDIEELLPDISRDRLRRSTQKLDRTKWASRKVGGRGHPDVFTFLDSPPTGTYPNYRLAAAHNLLDSMPVTWHLSGLSMPVTGNLLDSVPVTGHLLDSMPVTGNLSGLSLPAAGNLSPPSSSTPVPPPLPDARAREVDEKTETRSGFVHPDAERAIDEAGHALSGCRGSLRDYLARGRVKSANQAAYVFRLVSSLEGSDEWMWSDRRGNRITEVRTKIIAAALNELAASDEIGKHFPEARGGFGNLRSKVRYLVASTLGVERDGASRGDRPYQSAREEEAEIQQNRERARERGQAASTDEARQEVEKHHRGMLEAKRWYDGQTKRVRSAVDHDAESRVKLLYSDMRKAPKGYVESAFLEAVSAQQQGAAP